ncbi:MAG: ribosomal-protein-alanine N-acetyltransferase, partial [Candidatus Obscuribacterales bacterium]|nr:ribosomal-protein-alanine N-acetyltransferase [Steroidobacteraceae bacterium]
LSWLHQSAITAGTFLIRLELRASNSTALRFYASAGYRQHNYVQGYYSHIEDAVCMSRDLSKH